jgi:adenosine kinase
VKRVLVCGSIAYDNIMVFRGRFKDHILPEQIHILNVAFLVPDLRREFGGCAGNIGYGLKLLGADPLIMGTVGDDAAPYLERLDALGLARNHVRLVPATLTAQAFITTDLDDNQITAFHPGAMSHSATNRIDATLDVGLAIVAPDGREGMVGHVNELAAARIPFMFDPGQQLPAFSGEELLTMIDAASYLAVNDYEGRLLVDRTGRGLEELARMVDALIVTKGAAGSTIYAGGQQHEIPIVKPTAVVDPTGCGDAYRAGLLYGIAAGRDWPAVGRLAALMGAIKIAHRGGQNYRPSRNEIAAQYKENFGASIF